MTVLTDVDSPTSSPDGANSKGQRGSSGRGALVRKLRTSAPVLPFLAYVILVLGVPTVVIVLYAFRSNTGHLTLSNIHTILAAQTKANPTGGQYRAGFENSLELAARHRARPGLSRHVYRLRHSPRRSTRFKRITSATSGRARAVRWRQPRLHVRRGALNATTGIVTKWLGAVGFDPWNHGFDLYKFWGVALRLHVLPNPSHGPYHHPRLRGSAARLARSGGEPRCVALALLALRGMPVLTPAILGSMFLLFGSGFSAYATAEALTGGTIAITPIQIGAILQGNVIANQVNIAYALAFAMIVILLVTVVFYALLRRRTSRWLL